MPERFRITVKSACFRFSVFSALIYMQYPPTNQSNQHMHASSRAFFPRLASVAWFCFEFWLVQCVIWVLWLVEKILFYFITPALIGCRAIKLSLHSYDVITQRRLLYIIKRDIKIYRVKCFPQLHTGLPVQSSYEYRINFKYSLIP